MRNDTSRLRGLGEQIIKLAKKGMSYRQIQKELGCSKSTIAYHLGKGQKEKAYLRMKKSGCSVGRTKAEVNRSMLRGKLARNKALLLID
jgi:transposase